MNLQKILSKAIRSRSVNISELSRETGISRNQIYRIASGKSEPQVSTALKILGKMGITITLTENPKKAKTIA